MSPSVEPFNEAKYKALMDGLECCEIQFTQAFGANQEKRWDSEYYKKVFLQNEKRLRTNHTKPFYELCHFVRKGIFDLSPEFYQETGVPFIRTSEIKNPTVNWATTVFLDNTINNQNRATVLNPGDLVFTKIGAYIGDVALLPKKYAQYNFSQNVAGASLKDKKQGAVLLSFFLTKTGRLQILRSSMLSGQGKLELNDIRNYRIPIFGKVFCDALCEYFENIEETEASASAKYARAEILINRTLSNDGAPQSNISIKELSASFGQTGRLDAEYYQPKYDELMKNLLKHGCKNLGGEEGLVDIKKSIEPGSDAYQDEGIPFVRISNLTKFGLDEPDIKVAEDIVQEVRKLYPKRDTILFSKDGSVGIAYKMEEDKQIITSGGILHLTVKNMDEILPDYLTLVLNSPIVQLQAERDAGGSIIQHWKPSEIEQVVIPVFPMPQQKELSDLVQESFMLRRKSKKLLDNAVKAVEMAIETDESTALAWLKTQQIGE